MDFGSFLAHAEAVFKKWKTASDLPGASEELEALPDPLRSCLKRVFSFQDSHVFHLGDDEKVMEAVNEIRPDLFKDLKDRIPMPYSDISMASKVQGLWVLDRVIRVPGGLPYHIKARLEKGLSESKYANDPSIHYREDLMFFRVGEDADFLIPWVGIYCGTHADGCLVWSIITPYRDGAEIGVFDPRSVDLVENHLIAEASSIALQIALISHPMNYIVRVTPKLTPHETRRVAAGKRYPVEKKPHFIVVDHDVLTTISPGGPKGTHASPVPHHRRGHWRRLAERFCHARLLKGDRTFVRPAYVGERKFENDKNLYEVLMDFGVESPKEGGRDE